MHQDRNLALTCAACVTLGAALGAAVVAMSVAPDLGEWAEQWGGLVGSIVGAAATIVAGLFAWFIAKRSLAPVYEQLEEMRRQSAATAHAAVTETALGPRPINGYAD